MTDFLAKAPTLDANWRAVVLFGRNVASYKFALAKTLLGMIDRSDDRVPLEELAAPFARHLCEHLKLVDKQTTSWSSNGAGTTTGSGFPRRSCIARPSPRTAPMAGSQINSGAGPATRPHWNSSQATRWGLVTERLPTQAFRWNTLDLCTTSLDTAA